MIISSSELKQLNDEVFDVCIIGAGPAGITTALGLESTGLRILLLEGGDSKYSQESQDIYRGTVVGDKYFNLDETRLRYLGGSSNHWGGWCRTLDEIDFQAKNGFPLTKWPINKNDLDPYLEEASRILEIPEIPADSSLETDELKRVTMFMPSRAEPGQKYSVVRFGEKYSKRLRNSESVLLATDANVTALTPHNSAVKYVAVSYHDGTSINIQAKRFILATGGIENSRLLLWSNFLVNGELIKNDEALGKYWMDHPHFTLGKAFLTRKAPFEMKRVFFSPTNTLMENSKTLNCGLRLLPIQRKGTKKMIGDLMCAAPKAGKWAADLFNQDFLCGSKLRASWEQEPVSENRIELSEEKDSLGTPRTRLFYKKTENDLRTARVTAEAFGRYLGKNDLGRLQLDDWLINNSGFPEDDELAGHHHLGGTRMAATPDLGVVDNNCKVFGMSNLFIAGSSVFPSGGHANPTLTIVQLALRLAEHLRKNQSDIA